jgi:dTMP kinase
MFFAIDRFEDYLEKKDTFSAYDYIISNRYVSASMIHLASKIDDKKEREEFIFWLEDFEYNILNIKKPDKVLFLNLSLETSKKLVSKKPQREYLKD